MLPRATDDGPCQRIERGTGDDRPDSLPRFLRGPGDQDILATRRQALGNRSYLSRSLAWTENNFRKTLPNCEMMIDACISQIFEGQAPPEGKNVIGGPVGRHIAGTDGGKQLANILGSHR